MQNRLLLVEVKNVLIQIDFNAKSTSTSRSEKCVDFRNETGRSIPSQVLLFKGLSHFRFSRVEFNDLAGTLCRRPQGPRLWISYSCDVAIVNVYGLCFF